jgi:2-succinyl-5-enolpyruvyl-6-hydroxy-3-cyclohexene-1-carboxylate synthase
VRRWVGFCKQLPFETPFKLILHSICFFNMTQTTSKIGVQILLDALVKLGIEDLVFSPGSRNAPLVIGLVGSGKFRSVCIHDERSAAFYALGIALVSRKPVPVLCTSGSALLNYSPAVAEAYYQRVPFLVISADRPLEWIDRGDGQTIRQAGVYSNFIDYQISFPSEAKTRHLQETYNSEIHKALHFAKSGPVHINMPFEEPLYQLVEAENLNLPKIDFDPAEYSVSNDELALFQESWVKHKKRMILVGQMSPVNQLNQVLSAFASDADTVILTENTSNVELDGAIPCIDRVLAAFDNSDERFMPEMLVVLGNAVISKKIKVFLRKSNLQVVWKIGTDFPEMDTYERLDHSVAVPERLFFEQLMQSDTLSFSADENHNSFGNLWRNTFLKTEALHQNFERNTDFSDFKVMQSVLEIIPKDSVFHVGNSSVARYAQLFNIRKNLEVHCNRGTSGIDGSVSTAVGAAAKQLDKMHTLVVGDVSFFYDSNALWNQYLSDNLRIILIHNGGGGIFEIIPGPDNSSFRDDFFVAKHDFSAEHLCKAFKVEYAFASDLKSFENELNTLYSPTESGRPKLLEVNTAEMSNAEILKGYFEQMR